MLSLEKLRRSHLLAASILLRQLRDCGGVWSDGRTVYRGDELAALRGSTLNRIIHLKERDFEKRREPKMARMSKNFTSARAFLGQANDETISAWITRILRDYSGTKDIGGLERSLVARRLLRKNYPVSARQLDPLHRYSDKEWSYVRNSREHFAWALKDDITLDCGVRACAGVKAIPDGRGFSIDVLGMLVSVPEKNVRKLGRLHA